MTFCFLLLCVSSYERSCPVVLCRNRGSGQRQCVCGRLMSTLCLSGNMDNIRRVMTLTWRIFNKCCHSSYACHVCQYEQTPNLSFAFLLQVSGSGSVPYIALSDAYCSCPAWFQFVLYKKDALYCKHQLAIRLAKALGRLQINRISDDQFGFLLCQEATLFTYNQSKRIPYY